MFSFIRHILPGFFWRNRQLNYVRMNFRTVLLKIEKLSEFFFPEISKLCSNVCLNLYLNLDYLVVALKTSFIIKTFLCGCCGQMLFFINLVKTFLMSKMSSKMYVTWSGLNFDKWKTFHLRIIVVDDFSPSLVKLKSGKFTSLDKIIILTWKLLAISSQTFSCDLRSSRT